jgi:hypothetical protein
MKIRTAFIIISSIMAINSASADDKATTFIIKNETKKPLTVKIMPENVKFGTLMATVGLGSKSKILNDHTKKIPPGKEHRITSKSFLIKKSASGKDKKAPIKKVNIIGTIGLKIPGRCDSIPLDGKLHYISFKPHYKFYGKKQLGIQCSGR